MELVAEVEVLAPNPTSARQYVIDRDELLRLREAISNSGQTLRLPGAEADLHPI